MLYTPFAFKLLTSCCILPSYSIAFVVLLVRLLACLYACVPMRPVYLYCSGATSSPWSVPTSRCSSDGCTGDYGSSPLQVIIAWCTQYNITTTYHVTHTANNIPLFLPLPMLPCYSYYHYPTINTSVLYSIAVESKSLLLTNEGCDVGHCTWAQVGYMTCPWLPDATNINMSLFPVIPYLSFIHTYLLLFVSRCLRDTHF